MGTGIPNMRRRRETQTTGRKFSWQEIDYHLGSLYSKK